MKTTLDQLPSCTAPALAAAFPSAEMTPGNLGNILREAGLSARAEGYELIPALNALLGHLRKLASEANSETAKDNARKKRAEADAAEIATAKAMGELIAKEDILPFWADAAIRVRQTIDDADYLKPSQKLRLITAMEKIKLESE